MSDLFREWSEYVPPIEHFKMPTLSERINKLYSLLMKHRERYVRAWMAYYKADPSQVHLVTQFAGNGEIMRMEYRKDTDAVAELVKAARLVHDTSDSPHGARLWEALKPFEGP